MAQIDFSNAVLEYSSDSYRYVDQSYLAFGPGTTIRLWNDNNYSLDVSNVYVTNTLNKVTYEVIGSVPSSILPASGNTQMIVKIASSSSQNPRYIIKNISYDAGDVFDFVIELSLSVT